MSIFSSKQIDKNYIKVRWQEPYVSHALNRSKFGVIPTGIYSGFNIESTGYRTYKVNGNTPAGFDFQGNANEYGKDSYTATSGYSVAVFSDNLGHATTVSIPPSSVSGEFEFDFSGEENTQKIIAVDVDYAISSETTGRVIAVDSSELVSNPEYLVVGVIDVPVSGVSGSGTDVNYQHVDYPRSQPFATPRKYGFMSPKQALAVENISDEVDAIYCSSDDANVWWRNYNVSGVEIGRLDFDGTIVYNQPTTDWNVQVTVSGTVVSGIEDNDVVYFQYPTDGSVSAAPLLIAENNAIPIPPAGYQTTIFGIRCNNDFWFKNGQKWEVGESKPFGVTSKYPNLYVGETGNPPGLEEVSGIFFDNAQVFPQAGGKDVRIFVNVSGAIPNQPLEEEFIVTDDNGQMSFTTTNPDLFWVFDHARTDIKVYRNGVFLTQYDEGTSGLTYSNGDPIWGWTKAGTRTIELETKAPKNAVITIRLEADRGIQALENTFLVDSVTGQQEFTTNFGFSTDNDVHDIQVFRNGQKIQYEDNPFNALIHGGQKTGEQEFTFNDFLPKNSVVTIRKEASAGPASGVSGGGGDFWFDLIDADLLPDTPNTYDVGAPGNEMKDGYFAGDFYIGGKLTVVSGIDPIYLEFDPVDPNAISIPTKSLFVDSTAGNALYFKDNAGNNQLLISGTSGINPAEDEIMSNPYPFGIEAPRAVSLSTSGNTFLLTDVNDPQLSNNFFGILTENVSAVGTPDEDFGSVKWRGLLNVGSGFENGAMYVSGTGAEAGTLVQDAPGVSGVSVIKVGLVKNTSLYLRPTDVFTL